MIYYVSAEAPRSGCGSSRNPFQTISEAAKVACPGDEIIVSPGIYREYVNLPRGGTGEDQRISYRSLEPLGAVITGAEVISHWTPYQGNIWVARIPNRIFGAYNPYTTLISGDWYSQRFPLHTGEIYLNGKAMYETFSLEEVLSPTPCLASWDPGFSVYKWYTAQDPAKDCTLLYANFQGADPNAELVEANVRRNCFYPVKTGVSYITLSGFSIKQAATTWAPPTAYQDGMVGPHWSKGWIIEDCEISDSRCAGISLGKYLQPENENKWTTAYYKDGTQNERDAIFQALNDGWSRDTVGSHTVRRCNIHDCGQAGIVGHLGCIFSVIEDNQIHHINHRQDLSGAEIGGIKLHAAIDTVIRRNHIHHCTRGLWLDWQAQGTRVSQNLFHHNIPPMGTRVTDALAEDLFIEVSHGPTLVDNNLLLSDCACRLSTQGIALVHNLIAGSFTWVGNGTDNGGSRIPTPRYTPYHVPHSTQVAGFMTILHGDARFYNNIFVQKEIRKDLEAFAKSAGCHGLNQLHFTCGTKPFDGYPTTKTYFSQFNAVTAVDHEGKDIYYDHLPVYTGGNLYCNGAQPWDGEEGYTLDTGRQVTLELKELHGHWYLETNLYDNFSAPKLPIADTWLLGEAFEPEQPFEAADKSPIVFDRDYQGNRRTISTIPGPFALGYEIEQPLV